VYGDQHVGSGRVRVCRAVPLTCCVEAHHMRLRGSGQPTFAASFTRSEHHGRRGLLKPSL
jgi:hypothetical protein